MTKEEIKNECGGPDDPETKEALKAADACAARPPEKKRMGPMFGGHLEVLARALRAAWAKLAEVTKERDEWKESRNFLHALQEDLTKKLAEKSALLERALAEKEQSDLYKRNWEDTEKTACDVLMDELDAALARLAAQEKKP